MREDWITKTLGEIGEFTRGGNFTKSDFVEIGIPCIHYGQIHMHYGVTTEKTLSYLPKDFQKIKYAKKGDLIIAITSEDDEGSCKCTAWLGNENVAVGGHIAVYHHSLDPKFMSYYFRSPQFQKEKLAFTHGFKVVEIKPSDIAKIRISYPKSLSEQERIVSLLDTQFAKIDALKANAASQLQAAKDLFQAALKQLLIPKEGCVEKDLKSIGKTQTGCTPSMSHKEYYNEDYIPFIKPSEINYDGVGGINYDTQMLSKLGADNGRVFKANSIFMVCIGTIGKLGFSNKEVSCNQQINVLSPYDEYCAKFIYYTLLNPIFQNKVDVIARSAQATLPIISKGKWEKLTVLIPSLPEQERIAARLDAISEKVKALQANYNQTINLCNDLKQSLLKSIFA